MTRENPVELKRAKSPEEPLGRKRAVSPKEPMTEERAEDRPELTVLVLLRDQLQKLRIAEGNRALAADRLNDARQADVHWNYEKRLHVLEEDVVTDVQAEMRNHPAWPWLKEIHGVAETSAALIVGPIDIHRANTVSALWRYAGFGVVDGKRERPVKGEKLHYNARLKTMVWRLISRQVMLSGPYERTYREAKHRYETTRKDWTKGHIHQAALRVAAKLFLSHLWHVWREAEGLSTRGPWIEQYGGPEHTIIDPWEFIAEDSK